LTRNKKVLWNKKLVDITVKKIGHPKFFSLQHFFFSALHEHFFLHVVLCQNSILLQWMPTQQSKTKNKVKSWLGTCNKYTYRVTQSVQYVQQQTSLHFCARIGKHVAIMRNKRRKYNHLAAILQRAIVRRIKTAVAAKANRSTFIKQVKATKASQQQSSTAITVTSSSNSSSTTQIHAKDLFYFDSDLGCHLFKVNNASAASSSSKKFTEAMKHLHVILDDKSVATLSPRCWLNDAIINTFCNLVCLSHENISMVSSQLSAATIFSNNNCSAAQFEHLARRHCLDRLTNTSAYDYLVDPKRNIVIIPINTPSHWLLAIWFKTQNVRNNNFFCGNFKQKF